MTEDEKNAAVGRALGIGQSTIAGLSPCTDCKHTRRDHDHDGECFARPDNQSPTDDGFCDCNAFVEGG